MRQYNLIDCPHFRELRHQRELSPDENLIASRMVWPAFANQSKNSFQKIDYSPAYWLYVHQYSANCTKLLSSRPLISVRSTSSRTTVRARARAIDFRVSMLLLLITKELLSVSFLLLHCFPPLLFLYFIYDMCRLTRTRITSPAAFGDLKHRLNRTDSLCLSR